MISLFCYVVNLSGKTAWSYNLAFCTDCLWLEQREATVSVLRWLVAGVADFLFSYFQGDAFAECTNARHTHL